VRFFFPFPSPPLYSGRLIESKDERKKMIDERGGLERVEDALRMYPFFFSFLPLNSCYKVVMWCYVVVETATKTPSRSRPLLFFFFFLLLVDCRSWMRRT